MNRPRPNVPIHFEPWEDHLPDGHGGALCGTDPWAGPWLDTDPTLRGARLCEDCKRKAGLT